MKSSTLNVTIYNAIFNVQSGIISYFSKMQGKEKIYYNKEKK
jgi:hypothetical protein